MRAQIRLLLASAVVILLAAWPAQSQVTGCGTSGACGDCVYSQNECIEYCEQQCLDFCCCEESFCCPGGLSAYCGQCGS